MSHVELLVVGYLGDEDFVLVAKFVVISCVRVEQVGEHPSSSLPLKNDYYVDLRVCEHMTAKTNFLGRHLVHLGRRRSRPLKVLIDEQRRELADMKHENRRLERSLVKKSIKIDALDLAGSRKRSKSIADSIETENLQVEAVFPNSDYSYGVFFNFAG